MSRDNFLMSGCPFETFKRRSCSKLSLFRYLFFRYTIDEKPLSHKYVVEKGIINLTARSAISGNSFILCNQKSVKDIFFKEDLRVSSQDSSIICSFSFTEPYSG